MANYLDDTVSTVIDIRSGPPFITLSPAIPVGNVIQDIAVSPNGEYVLVCKWNDDNVAVIGLLSVSAFNS